MGSRVVVIDGKKYVLLEDGVTLNEYKDAIIANTLAENQQRVVESAKKLGISKNTIYRAKGDKGLLNG